MQLTRRTLVREVSSIRDTQCGFKVFRHELAAAVFGARASRSFAFDIEVLFVARQARAARIVAMPVETTFRDESTYDVRKHLPLLLRDIVQVRRNDRAGLYR